MARAVMWVNNKTLIIIYDDGKIKKSCVKGKKKHVKRKWFYLAFGS
jgi:hypothetical protein